MLRAPVLLLAVILRGTSASRRRESMRVPINTFAPIQTHTDRYTDNQGLRVWGYRQACRRDGVERNASNGVQHQTA